PHRQRRRDESINCASFIQSMVLAARIWSKDHGDHLPPDILRTSMLATVSADGQMQPGRVESKPATLRLSVHIKFPGGGKGSFLVIRLELRKQLPNVVLSPLPN